MAIWILLCAWIIAVPDAWASDLLVQSWGEPVVVTVDGVEVGATPLSVSDLYGEQARIGFRARSSAPDLLDVTVPLSTWSRLVVFVDLPARLAEVTVETRLRPGESTRPPEPAPAMGEAGEVRGPPPPEPGPEPEVAPPAGPTGDVYVEADAAGAELLVDGEATGLIAPATIKGLPVGAHTIEARTDCEGASEEVEVLPDRIVRLELELATGTGTLQVSTSPTGAVVVFDGALAGNTPLTLGQVPCMEHVLEVRAPGHRRVSERVLVEAFGTTEVSYGLRPTGSGTLVVGVEPVDARVLLDDREIAVGPVTRDGVPVGSHTVRVVREGHATVDRTVVVRPEEVTRVDVSLVPMLPSTRRPRAVRTPRDGASPARIVLDVATTGGGLALGTAATVHYAQATRAYQRYLDEPDDLVARRIYDDEVRPRKPLIIGEAIGGAALLALGTTLWLTTDFSVAPAPGGLALRGRW